jgi:mycarose O-acyltransferase
VAASRKAPPRLPSLTGLRFVAAGFVFAFHSTFLYPFASPLVRKNLYTLFYEGGQAGVTFFFVLSGFVLAWSARSTDTAPGFWRRRFFKIYPNHLLTFVAALILFSAGSNWYLSALGHKASGTFPAWTAIPNLLLLHSWFGPSSTVLLSFNEVSWTLSCEALFYFCFPFILRLINKIRPERLGLATILSGVAVFSVPTFLTLGPQTGMFNGLGFNAWQIWIGYHLPPVAMLQFIWGMFLAKFVLSGGRPPLKIGGAAALAVGAMYLIPVFPGTYSFSALTAIPLGLIVAAAATADVEGRRTFLATRPMVWLGEISFAFYMWSWMVLAYGHHFLGDNDTKSTLGAAIETLLLFVVLLTIAWATFTFWEQPIMRRFANPRPSRRLAAITSGPSVRPTEASPSDPRQEDPQTILLAPLEAAERSGV